MLSKVKMTRDDRREKEEGDRSSAKTASAAKESPEKILKFALFGFDHTTMIAVHTLPI